MAADDICNYAKLTEQHTLILLWFTLIASSKGILQGEHRWKQARITHVPLNSCDLASQRKVALEFDM